MPRYHFHLIAGSETRDEEGEELPGLGAARRNAVIFLAEILNARSERFWTDGPLRVVVESDGRTVAVVETRDLTPLRTVN